MTEKAPVSAFSLLSSCSCRGCLKNPSGFLVIPDRTNPTLRDRYFFIKPVKPSDLEERLRSRVAKKPRN